MQKLQQISQDVGLEVPAHYFVDGPALRALEEVHRPVGTLHWTDQADIWPSQVSACWNTIEDDLNDLLQPLLDALPSPTGLPVLKSSFLANSQPHQLSFAGVGTSVITPGHDPHELVQAVQTLLAARYKSYAQYYRTVHPDACSLDVGILGVVHMPKMRMWGTAWGTPDGVVVHCSQRDVQPHRHAKFTVLTGHTSHPQVPQWLRQEVLGFDQLLDVLLHLTSSGMAGSHYDIEFCVSPQGTVRLSQWRPVPSCSQPLLTQSVLQGTQYVPPTPFTNPLPTVAAAVVDCTHYIPRPRERLTEEVWVVPYHGLFKVLSQLARSNIDRYPSLMVYHTGDPLTPLGHLHAIVPEDPRVQQVVHLTEQQCHAWLQRLPQSLLTH